MTSHDCIHNWKEKKEGIVRTVNVTHAKYKEYKKIKE